MDKYKLKTSGPKFEEDIKAAQFYYNDKLIVLCTGNKLNFYQYQLPMHEEIKDDVKRL